MKIHIQRASFVPTFSLVASFTAQKDLRPKYKCVKIDARDSKVVLSATDGETGARAEIAFENPFNIAREGRALLPAKLLGKIFSETNDEEILLELDGTRLTVKGDRFRYSLDTVADVDSFPDVKDFGDETTAFRIAGADLRKTIRRTVFASDLCNAHYALDGVKFFFRSDSVVAAATDGRRLAYQKIAASPVGELPEDFSETSAFFPIRALRQIQEAAKSSDEVLFATDGETARIKRGNVVVRSILKSGRFPDCEQIIPDTDGFQEVDFIADGLLRAVRQAEIVATEDKPGVVFSLEDGKVYLSAVGEETGDSVVELPVSYEGEPAKTTFDAKFLKEFLGALDPEEIVHFRFKSTEYRTLFETNDGYKHVLMQISTPNS